MQDKLKKILLVVLAIGWLTSFYFTSEVIVDASEVEPLDLLVNDYVTMEEVKQEVLSVDSQAHFEEIPEIQLLRILSTSKDVEKNMQESEAVSMVGHLADISIEDKRLSNQEIPLQTIMLPEIATTRAVSNEFEILDQLAWYKDTMLGSKQTLEKSSGLGVRIGLIDSGVDILHPLLSSVIDLTQAKSFVDNNSSIADENGHGTMVAGTIAQLAPEAKITPYRVLSATDGESFWTLSAMIQAVNDRQDILNMSLGTYKFSTNETEKLTIEAFERAVNYALDNNVLVVSSSGNKGLDLDAEFEETQLRHLPGSVPGVLATSALTQENQLASYSNIGSNVQQAAPGGDYVYVNGLLDLEQLFYTSYPTTMESGLESLGIPKGYMFTAGTSLAAPCVSGVAADYISYYQRLTGNKPTIAKLKEDIGSSSMDLSSEGKNKKYGYGLPQISEAYKKISNTIPPTGTFKSQTIQRNQPIAAIEFVTAIQSTSEGEVTVSYIKEPDFSRIGEQEVGILLEDMEGNQAELFGIVTIINSQPPTGTFLELVVEVNQPNRAEAYVTNIIEYSDGPVTVDFVTKPNFEQLGQQKVGIKLQDISGNTTILEGNVSIVDTQAPSAIFKEAKIERGKPVVPEMFVTNVSDNYDRKETIQLTFVHPVDTTKVGKQEVEICLMDSSGNKSTVKGQIEIVDLENTKKETLSSNSQERLTTSTAASYVLKQQNEKNNTTLPKTSEETSDFSKIGYLFLVGSLSSIWWRKGRNNG